MEIAIIQVAYKVIIGYFVVIFISNLFDRSAKVSHQVMYAFILVPFVLRLLSIR